MKNLSVLPTLGSLLLICGLVGCDLKLPSDEEQNSEANDEQGNIDGVDPDGLEDITVTGDDDDENSPDPMTFGELYIEDAFSNDDDTLAGELSETDVEEASGSGPEFSLTEPEADDDQEFDGEPDLEVEDDDPTAEMDDPEFVDMVLQKVFGVADSDDEETLGCITEQEMVDARFLPEELQDLISDEQRAKIDERRRKLHAAAAGDDGCIDEEEMTDLLHALRDRIRDYRKARFAKYGDRIKVRWHKIRERYDTDGDGKLSREELQELREKREEQHRKIKLRAAVILVRLCHRIAESDGDLPPALQRRIDMWEQKREYWRERHEERRRQKKDPSRHDDHEGTDPDEPASSLTTEENDDDVEVDDSFIDEAAEKARWAPKICRKVIEEVAARGLLGDVEKELHQKHEIDTDEPHEDHDGAPTP